MSLPRLDAGKTLDVGNVAASQNNYELHPAYDHFLISTTTPGGVNFTGFTGWWPGRTVYLTNNGASEAWTVVDESGSSVAANRVALTGNESVSVDETIALRYDDETSRWRLVR